MKKQSPIRLLTILLSISLLTALVGCSSHSGSEDLGGNKDTESYIKRTYPEEISHDDAPLGERSRDSFNLASYESAYNEFSSLLETEGNTNRLLELFEIIDDLVLDCKTDASLALYDRDMDITNKEYAESYTSKQNMYSQIDGRSVRLFQTVFSTDYADAFRAYIGEELAEQWEHANAESEEERTLKATIRELKKKYDLLTVQGAEPAAFKELYIETVNANNAYARLRGYDNYVEYAYSKTKGRDYTIADVRGIEEELLRNFVPIFHRYVAKIVKDVAYDAYEENHDSGEIKFSKMRDCVKNISPKFEESLDYLIRNQLYAVDASDTKGPSDYTVSLPAYNDAFIFIQPLGKVSDYKTVLHEFGHYSAHYYRPVSAFEPNLVTDVEEIMSQGLQLLCYDYYGAYYEEYGDALAESTIFQIMQAVPKGFAVNEAEYLSYTTEDLTPEKLDAIWSECNDKFYKPIGQSDDAWLGIPHVFQNPFYYIGYATSALTAFELFVESREDFEGSVDKYMKITELPAGTTYLEALEQVGLSDIFEPGTVKELSKEVAILFELTKREFVLK